jgi:DtxR family Mn-dependent transcriptional regulator
MSSETRTIPSLPRSPTPSEIGRSAARYLFAVSKLSESEDGRIATGELREYLDVTPASVTEMMSKLDDRGLADYEKYQGVTLTQQGEAFATRIAWRFCVVSTFFDSVLDANLDERAAFDIAVTLPEEGVFNLRNRVNSPCIGLCPESGGELDTCVG